MDGPAVPSSSATIELAPGVRLPSNALRLQFARGSGPGGQNVNKVNTKVEIWIPLTLIEGMSEAAKERLRGLAGSRLTIADDLHLSSETHRSQHANRQEVMDRLREMLVQACVVPRKRRARKPSKAAQRRRVDEKVRRGRTKALRRSSND